MFSTAIISVLGLVLFGSGMCGVEGHMAEHTVTVQPGFLIVQ